MDNDTKQVDLLQIKIENAKAKLPAETVNAIAAIDWRAAILSLREKKGYSFEQLGDLELETELLLCGLTSPAEYPKELETRMRISKAETDELVNTMNILVFNKIKEEMIKNSERKEIFEKKNTENSIPKKIVPEPTASIPPIIPPVIPEMPKNDTTVLKSAGIEVIKPEITTGEKPVESREDILKKVENPDKITPSIFAQKLSGSVQMPTVTTEHKIENITATKAPIVPPQTNTQAPKVDPYRELPE